MQKIAITPSLFILFILGLCQNVFSCVPPQAPSNISPSTNITVCSGTTNKLSATGVGVIGWYSAATGGTYLGKDFITIKLTTPNTYDYYVQDSTCAASTSRTKVTVVVKDVPKAAFSVPTLICDQSDIQFTNQSTITTGNLTYFWNFGDGGVSNSTNPIHQYAYASAKYVKLKVVSDFGCQDSITKNLALSESPSAEFTVGTACSRYKTELTFTGTKPPSFTTVFLWDFNGESTSTLENPSKLLDTGTKKITLYLTSSNGCKDSLTKFVNVRKQSKADFEVNDICANDSAIFINKSISGESYYWKFGDGRNSNLESPKHKFIISGISQTFNVTLTARISNGCSDSITKLINVNATPGSDFTYKINGFTITTTASQSTNVSLKWTFGNGDSSSNQSAKYTYSKLGKYNVCLTSRNAAGCYSQSCKMIPIRCGAKFTKGVDTTQKFKIFLINNSSNSASTTYLWDMGDGSTYTSRNPTHKYKSFGRFRVCLTVTDSACTSTFCDTIGMDSTGKLLKAGSFDLFVIEQSGSIVSKKHMVDFKCYPNPTNNKITIDLNNALINYDKLEIVNAIGQTRYVQTMDNSTKLFDVDLSMINQGLFFLKLSNQETYSFLRLIKN